jgi:2,3-bisphosphoglycerate-dependent phosphoglycerate mutase
MAETTQLTLIRHGETTMIADNRIHGHLDAPLSELGMRDARKTAAYFRGQTFDVLYASSLGRAMTTAGIIGEAIHLNPIPVDGLRERYYGLLEGKSLDLFEPDGSGPWYMRPYVYLALGLTGESEKHVAKRAVRSIEDLLSKHQGDRIMVVVHWGILGVLSQYFQGKDIYEWKTIGPWTACGITEFHANDGSWQAIRINDGSHLK